MTSCRPAVLMARNGQKCARYGHGAQGLPPSRTGLELETEMDGRMLHSKLLYCTIQQDKGETMTVGGAKAGGGR
jgi:hypothetical protein